MPFKWREIFAKENTITKVKADKAISIQFGLVGCRHNVSSLQRLLIDLEDSLAEPEKATS